MYILMWELDLNERLKNDQGRRNDKTVVLSCHEIKSHENI